MTTTSALLTLPVYVVDVPTPIEVLVGMVALVTAAFVVLVLTPAGTETVR